MKTSISPGMAVVIIIIVVLIVVAVGWKLTSGKASGPAEDEATDASMMNEPAEMGSPDAAAGGGGAETGTMDQGQQQESTESL